MSIQKTARDIIERLKPILYECYSKEIQEETEKDIAEMIQGYVTESEWEGK